jgi:hypothetical protein
MVLGLGGGLVLLVGGCCLVGAGGGPITRCCIHAHSLAQHESL